MKFTTALAAIALFVSGVLSRNPHRECKWSNKTASKKCNDISEICCEEEGKGAHKGSWTSECQPKTGCKSGFKKVEFGARRRRY